MKRFAFIVFTVVVQLSWTSGCRDEVPDVVCEPSVTTVSGSYAPQGPLCRDQPIFSEEFNSELDTNLWTHEQRLSPLGEFQWYVNDTENSYVENGRLIIQPTLTTDVIPDLTNCFINISTDVCQSGVCQFRCSADTPAPPVRSARLKTSGKFNVKYARVEIRAKLPAGDWLWPALWMIPTRSVYGSWPRSGEIDIMESRGNANISVNGQIGVNQYATTLHFGTTSSNSAWHTAHFTSNLPAGDRWSNEFHLYQMLWTPDGIEFRVDGGLVGAIPTGDGYYRRGRFSGPNIWVQGQLDAPFDQEFHFIINTAVGGTSGYFTDAQADKPWRNSQPKRALTDFWNARDQWLPTWELDDDESLESAFQVDYIRAWAV